MKREASERAMSSLLAVNSEMTVCNFDCQNSGAPAKNTMKPDLYLALSALFGASLWFQLPAKLASTWQVCESGGFGLNTMPLSLVPSRYLARCLIAWPWDCLGLVTNQAS